MNLLIRDVFVWCERRWRLIDTDPSGYAWIIDTQDRNAWITRVARSELEGCVREPAGDPSSVLPVKNARRAKAAQDYQLVTKALAAGRVIYDRRAGHRELARVAAEGGRHLRTIKNLLRRFWQ